MASITEPVDDVVEWFDRLQRRHRFLGFPLAVIKRYGEDHGGCLGALIS
jgi:membrane protein